MPTTAPPFPDVTVLLGDPRLPDVTKVDHRFSPEDLESVEKMREALDGLPGYRFTYFDDHTRLIEAFAADPPAFVLNFGDTGYRNDAARELHLPAFLEMLEVPYSGAGPGALALCYDKARVRAVAQACGVPVPEERYVSLAEADLDALDLPDDAFPALVKPSRGDGSVGITQQAVVHDAAEARAYLAHLRDAWPDRDALVQTFLPGAEYAIGLIGNPGGGFTVLPPLEVDYSDLPAGLPPILSYESKTIPSSPYWTDIRYRAAGLEAPRYEALTQHARTLFARLGCRDYARFDFRADAHGHVRLLEVNPNPAWCWDGKFNLMAGFAGWDYRELLRRILEAAQTRAAAVRG